MKSNYVNMNAKNVLFFTLWKSLFCIIIIIVIIIIIIIIALYFQYYK